MTDRAVLLADLKKQVVLLERHLREEAENPPWADKFDAEWRSAKSASRTAATYETWLDERVTQISVAWVLGTVFLRFCEDNELLEWPYLAGPGTRLDVALERQQAYIRSNPHSTDRDWILEGFAALSVSPVVAGLFDEAHNPMWQIEVPHHAAKELLEFWRRRGDNGEVVHSFADPSWETRFLGDLYQDLSEHAKKTYALLQTPEFVEEFILDYTLEPAVDEFGLAGLRTIDPTCGSGHFLLGIFHRLLSKWRAAEPATESWELIRRALSSVHGVDKNPFAASIARFRLLIAAMREAGVSRLDTATPDFPILVAIGDSLIHGRDAASYQDDLFADAEQHTYVTEDVLDYAKSVDLLGRSSYHVVVGNPPYITVKDKQENDNYRKAYKDVCSGQYALSVPFARRFFELGRYGTGFRQGAGHIGQITSNSFMKREFGKELIEAFFAQKIELTHVIDTSGAYIPGHGTPTVILVGRHQVPISTQVIRTVLGIRGEPSQPDNPAKGLVWSAITELISDPGTEGTWVSVADLQRAVLAVHPWRLAGGGAADLASDLEALSICRLSRKIDPPIGRSIRAGADEAYMRPIRRINRVVRSSPGGRPLLIGEVVRDWESSPDDCIIYPYQEIDSEALIEQLWVWRTSLRERRTFQGNMSDAGLFWYEYMQHTASAYRTRFSITFAFVATHNHFVLDRGGKVFKQSAPVIKLPKEASEDDHLALLGLLNSSTACFWLKQVSYPKGGDPIGGDGARVSAESWSDRYEFTGTKLQEYPLPSELPLGLGRELDRLALQLNSREPAAIAAADVPTYERLAGGQKEHEHIRGRMIALQEELDWEVYQLYGLLSDEEATERRARLDDVPELELGERAFEIVLARKVARGELETQWFARHGSTPITEIPTHWSDAYRRIVEKRIETIESRRDIALIERPECKRRWSTESWEKKQEKALRNWLLDRCENRKLWIAQTEFGSERPEPQTINRLADKLRRDADFVSVVRLYAGEDANLEKVLAGIIGDEHVPYLAQLRYKDTGLRKRAQWVRTWDKQREEDRLTAENGREQVWLDIDVPPKYGSGDFLKTTYWKNRGKLDVPKERFVSYPLANPDTDDSLLLGWAGWDHREQAYALMTVIDERSTQGGWEKDRLTPLVAGLAEMMPWVKQWHGEIDPDFGQSPADAFAAFLEAQQSRLGLSAADLRAWKPPKPKRSRNTRS